MGIGLMWKALFAVVVSSVVLSATANAADLQLPDSDLFTWSGLYLSGEAGPVSGDSSLVFANGNPASPIGLEGWVGGAAVGYQHQYGAWILGVEGKILGAGITGSNKCFNVLYTCSVDNIGPIFTIGPKVGYAWGRWALFGTAGFATAKLTTRNYRTSDGGDLDETSLWHNGWEAGIGVDYAVNDKFSLGLEFMHVELGSAFHRSDFFPGNPGFDHSVDAELSTVTARATWWLH